MGIFNDLFSSSSKRQSRQSVDSVSIGNMDEIRSEEFLEQNEDGVDSWEVQLNPESSGTATATDLIFNREGKRKISKSDAMSLSAAYSCMDRISANIAVMPISIKRKVGDEITDVEKHPAKYVLEKSPNEWQTQYTLIRQFVLDAINGNGYIWIRRNNYNGEILKLVYCDEASTELMNLGNGRWVYDYTDEDGGNFTIYPEDMIHLRALGNTGRKGLSVIKLHASTMRSGLDMTAYAESFFGAGAKPSGVVGVKNALDQAGWERLIKNWKKSSKQAEDNKNRVMFMPADLSYTAISISPLDAALIQSMKMSRGEIAGIFNVPGWMIGDSDKTSYSNITAMAIAFVRNTLQPWITNIEQEMNKKLFTKKELLDGYTVYFDMSVITRGTPEETMRLAVQGATGGLMTRNEGRIAIGYPRDETDPEMNKFLVNVSQANFTDDKSKSPESSKDNEDDNDKEPENDD